MLKSSSCRSEYKGNNNREQMFIITTYCKNWVFFFIIIFVIYVQYCTENLFIAVFAPFCVINQWTHINWNGKISKPGPDPNICNGHGLGRWKMIKKKLQGKKKLVFEVHTRLSQFRCEQIKAEGGKSGLWPRMTGLGECHSNCGAITGTRWWVIALRSVVSPSWRTLLTLAHL